MGFKRRVKKLEDVEDLNEDNKTERDKIIRVAKILSMYFENGNKEEVDEIVKHKGEIWVKEWERLKNATIPDEWQEKIDEERRRSNGI